MDQQLCTIYGPVFPTPPPPMVMPPCGVGCCGVKAGHGVVEWGWLSTATAATTTTPTATTATATAATTTPAAAHYCYYCCCCYNLLLLLLRPLLQLLLLLLLLLLLRGAGGASAWRGRGVGARGTDAYIHVAVAAIGKYSWLSNFHEW